MKIGLLLKEFKIPTLNSTIFRDTEIRFFVRSCAQVILQTNLESSKNYNSANIQRTDLYLSLAWEVYFSGLAVWGQASKTSLNKIVILQTKVLRMIHYMDIREHTIPLFIDVDILPVTSMFCKSVAGLMHDINNKNSPPNLLNLFEKTIHSYNTRSSTSGNFHVQSSKLEIHKKSFSRFDVKLWKEKITIWRHH